MKAIEKIIFNVLASRRSVVLPGVGTLAVERRSAVVSGRDVKAPENRIVFSETEKEGVPTLPELMESMGVDPQQASANYSQWLNEVSSNDGLMIDGVGTLSRNSFVPSQELDQILNPAGAALANGGRDGKSNKPRRGLTNILLIVIILLLLALGGLYVRNTYCGGTWFKCKNAPAQPVREIQTEAQPVMPTEQIAPVVETEKNPVKRFHVVAGTFVQEQNADELIKWYKRYYPELAPEKVKYRNGRTIVSIFSADNEREAILKMQSLANSHSEPDYWVCEIKELL